jgi:ectoine hydroxylase-related dioxygenase (phytanoyl-CoA dioxygenase family)
LNTACTEIAQNGFAIIEDVYTHAEVESIIRLIENVDKNKPTFRKTDDLFAIRQFLKEVPEVCPLIFSEKLIQIINTQFGIDYFAVKSIYFDKPGLSNWFVSYHQDLTISVNKKTNIEGYGPWTVKHNQFAVQPPLVILQQNFTIRIHLDDTNEYNGALKVVPGSHLKGVYRAETIDWTIEQEQVCKVKVGGVMLMSPLLLHASNRTTNNKKRRVLHIEFSKAELPVELSWSERVDF